MSREKPSSQQRMFVLLRLGKAYLLLCCSELHLQGTTRTKPRALIAVAQVEYLLPTLSPAALGLYTLSGTREPHRRLLLFPHHSYFIATLFSERRKKKPSDFLYLVLLFKPGLLILSLSLLPFTNVSPFKSTSF